MRKTKQKKGNVSAKRSKFSKKQASKLKDLVLHVITKEISN